MRCIDDAVSRILAMHAVAAVSYGFPRAAGITWLEREALVNALSTPEKRFLLEDGGCAEDFQVQVEGMWALAWSLAFVEEFDFTRHCDDQFVRLLPNLKINEPSTDFRRKANLRPVGQVVAACDLAYCLHWALRDAQLTGKAPPAKLTAYVIVERRRSLEWLLNDHDWEHIPLDT